MQQSDGKDIRDHIKKKVKVNLTVPLPDFAVRKVVFFNSDNPKSPT